MKYSMDYLLSEKVAFDFRSHHIWKYFPIFTNTIFFSLLIYFLNSLYSRLRNISSLLFMKKIIAPLALIASLSALASCTKEPVSETVTPETKNTRVEVEVQPAPQAPVETVPTSTATGSLPENTQSGTGPSAMPRIIPVENQS